MKRNKNIYAYILTIIAVAAQLGCKKPYFPAVIVSNSNYLVVEGVIQSGQDSTNIKLSRTVNLSSGIASNPEKGAVVHVESDQNISYPLKENGNGFYGAAALSLDNSHKYRLKITTRDGKTYQSDFTAVMITPPIDSLWYEVTSSGLNLYSNAHDPGNNSRYYRWDYQETYIYISGINTYFKFQNNKVLFRTPDEYVNTCYVTTKSSNIIINSSARLSNDVIYKNPITQLSMSSEKILHRYSILLKQYVITKEAYDFWTILQKNTEKLGTIFDAQPSQVTGNIHCITDPSEPVLGYMSVSTVSQKRIFIDKTELPIWPVPQNDCLPYTITWHKSDPVPYELTKFIQIPLAPIDVSYDAKKKDSLYSVKVGDYFCVDCTYHGTNKKPAFWK
ncbi:MAG: hypothetical protein NVSMB24_10920 [Mucilaginibacter sp.]